MSKEISVAGLSIGIAGTWGLSIAIIGLLAHFTGIGSSFIESIDALYPGTGTGPRGILMVTICGIFHGMVSGALIAVFYNAYCRTLAD